MLPLVGVTGSKDIQPAVLPIFSMRFIVLVTHGSSSYVLVADIAIASYRCGDTSASLSARGTRS
jgi:hypothetical protein